MASKLHRSHATEGIQSRMEEGADGCVNEGRGRGEAEEQAEQRDEVKSPPRNAIGASAVE